MYQRNPFLFLKEDMCLERKHMLPGCLFSLNLFLSYAKGIALHAAHPCTSTEGDWGGGMKYQETAE